MWRVIQTEGKKPSLRRSFKDKLGREFIRGGASRKTTTRRDPGQSIAGRRNGAFGEARDGPSHGNKPAKGPREGTRIKGFMAWLQQRKESMY